LAAREIVKAEQPAVIEETAINDTTNPTHPNPTTNAALPERGPPYPTRGGGLSVTRANHMPLPIHGCNGRKMLWIFADVQSASIRFPHHEQADQQHTRADRAPLSEKRGAASARGLATFRKPGKPDMA